MLGKLMKYEWKETWKAGCGVLFVMAVGTLLGFLGLRGMISGGDRMEWIYAYGSDSLEFGAAMMQMAGAFSIMLFVMVLTFSVFFMFIYLVVRYYRTMFSSQGYLTHTLPVRKWELFWSKVLVSGFWLIIVYIGLLVSVFGLILLTAGAEASVEEVLQAFRELGKIMNQVLLSMNIDDTTLVVGTIVTMVLTPFLSLVMTFGAFTIGQLFSGSRVVVCFVVYFGIIIVQYILQLVMRGVLVAGISNAQAGTDRALDGVNWYLFLSVYGKLAVSIALAAGVYLWSMHVLNKKLNLK